MKKLFFALLLLPLFQVQAQVKVPQPSTKSVIEQMVGLTHIKVDYTRPAQRGRTLFGGLVPFGKIWRTGANENTTISLSEDIKINNQILRKGKYALYTKPEPTHWRVYFYTDTQNWGLPKSWAEDKIALEVTCQASKYPTSTEYFTIEVNPINNNDGNLVLRWGDTAVFVPFETFTHQQAMASIEANLSQKPTARDYFNAGVYLLNIEQNLPKALEYMEQAIALQKDAPYYMLRQKSLVLAKLGRKQDAINVAKESLQKAIIAKNDDYIRMNQNSISEWEK